MTSVDLKPLAMIVDDALSLVGGYNATPDDGISDTPLPSLLEQCRALLNRSRALDKEPVRTLHHFACTGGTLIGRCIAGLPNVLVMSEVDPLSTMGVKPDKPVFAPTDIIRHLRYSKRAVSDDLVIDAFMAAFNVVHDRMTAQGCRLVIRDHTHSHYCTGPDLPERPTLRQLLGRSHQVVPIVTVRDPLESYISLSALLSGRAHFSPFTFDEYCRRYLAFIEEYADAPRFRYEDFVAAPKSELKRMCSALSLPYDDFALDFLSVIRLTGDSGRGGDVIEARPSKAPADDLAEEAEGSALYKRLKSELGYT